MSRPRVVDPVVSFTVSLPTSTIQRLNMLADRLHQQGYARRSAGKLARELILGALPTHESRLGYAYSADALSVPPLPYGAPVGSYHPIASLPPPPAHAAPIFAPDSEFAQPPGPPPLEGPTLAEIASWGQERAIAEANQSLEGFFDRVVTHDPIHDPRPSNVP